jgi:hypothetical protein
MCKYSYLSGACANRSVESLHCVGEDECEFSGMNILGPVTKDHARDTVGASKWLGLYCHAHGKYLCGEGSGCPTARERLPHRTESFQSRFGDDRESW